MGYEWLLFFHLLAGMIWLGGIAVLAALATLTARRHDAGEVARLTATLRRLGPIVLAPMPVSVLAFGVALVVDGSEWSFGQAWVEAGLGLFTAVFVLGIGHQARAAIGAERAAVEGRAADASRLLGRWALGAWVLLALLVAAVADMVFKPGF